MKDSVPTTDFEYSGYYFELFSKGKVNNIWSVLKADGECFDFVQWLKLPVGTTRLAVVKNFDYNLVK